MSDTVALPQRSQVQPYASQAWLATAMWVTVILGVTIHRAIPEIPGPYIVLLRAAGAGTALWLIAVSSGNRAKPSEPQLLGWFALVPAIAIALSLLRSDINDTTGHIASLLVLVAVSRLAPQERILSARRALWILVGGSIALGLVYSNAVASNERAFLRPIYDGRLVGVLETPNVMGMYSVLLIVFTLLGKSHFRRYWGVTLGLAGILAASSQTSLVCAVVLIGIYVAVQMAHHGHSAVVFTIAWSMTTILAGLSLWLSIAHPMWHSQEWTSHVTLSARTDIWKYLLRGNIPFTGLGQARIDALFDDAHIQGATGVGSAHNVFLDGYVRDGLLGLGAVVMVLMATLTAIVRSRSWLTLFAFVPLLLIGVTEVSPFHVPAFALFYAAISATLAHQLGATSEGTTRVDDPQSPSRNVQSAVETTLLLRRA